MTAPRTPAEMREALGRIVREVWIAWAKEQPNPKPSWLVPWEGLSEPDREVDRRIGERLAREGAATPLPAPEAPSPEEMARAWLPDELSPQRVPVNVLPIFAAGVAAERARAAAREQEMAAEVEGLRGVVGRLLAILTPLP